MGVIMDKVLFACEECDKKFEFPFKEISDLQDAKCEFCGNENVFIRKFIYENEPDRTPIKTGDRGCGTSGRFK